jgi:hypothetical protein
MAALEGEIKTPFGQVQKKTAVIIGGGLVLILGIVWYRSKKASDAAASVAAAGQSEINPATGYPYGSAEDAAAMAAQADYISAGGGGVGGSGGGGSAGQPGFTSNGQWAQAAVQYMQAEGLVEDPAQLSHALGVYITGKPATELDAGLIAQAIAFQGYPPITGPSGYPPSINTSPIVTDPPDNDDDEHPPVGGNRLPAPSGFHDTGAQWPDALELQWAGVPGAASYKVHDGFSGDNERNVGNVTGIMVRGLVHDGTYFNQVAAVDSAGVTGNWSPVLTSHTKK